MLTREEIGFVAEQKTAYSGRSPKLLDHLREALRARHYSRRTEQTYYYAFRHAFAKHLLEAGYDICINREALR